ncbi:prepilin-type N-terminal cleavage/methylation domain-containing protein [Ruminococcus sp. NK3A76]|uniref:prepilin-type N-terminal cleavage/methylation domain-containing protein n=1 Tax=Ruminococcus sp. NK3A76 TaxID=877411 RepID=UPI00048B6A48|nr:prepilin-type N-terminal cleavage/methylation domain-containing protein [Ruminococcus sp. NK3A76]
MKKSNRSGFTLVELIIVVALLSIMLGAILRLIDPIRNVYHDTLDTVNTKTVGETMISFVEDKTRYATNMLILRDYKGVPQINANTAKGTARVGNTSVEFTDVIIIDNHNLRGYGLSDYQGDTGSLAARKNCRGTIYTIGKIGESGTLDLTKLNTGTIGDDVYGAYSYDISCCTKTLANARKTLNFSVASYPMELSSGSYVKTAEPEYKAERYFDLVNINLPNDSFNILDDVDFTATDDYTKYPQQVVAPSGLTTQQQSFFDTNDDNRFTYIFYKINKTNEDQSYMVKFLVSPDDPVTSWKNKPLCSDQKVKAGGYLPESMIPTIPTRAGFTFSQFEVDGNVIARDDIPTYAINTDTIFTVRYAKDANYLEHTLKFYDTDGSLVPGDFAAINNEKATAYAPSPTYDNVTQYYEWIERSTHQPIDVFICSGSTSQTFEFDAKVYNKFKIEFKDEDGIVIDTQYVKNKGEINLIAVPASKNPLKTSGEWVVGGTNYGAANINGDTVITPKYLTITTPITPPSSGAKFEMDQVSTSGWANHLGWDNTAGKNKVCDLIQLSLTIKNTGSAKCSSSAVYKVQIKFNESIRNSVNCGYLAPGHSITVVDDKTIIYTFSGSEVDPGQMYYSSCFQVLGQAEKYQGAASTLAVVSATLI